MTASSDSCEAVAKAVEAVSCIVAEPLANPRETPADCIVVPEDAAATLRRRLGLAPHETPRIAYVAGPGDLVGTFEHWTRGAFDPRVPVVAYSTMFYTLTEKLEAEALIISEHDRRPAEAHPRFHFAGVAPDKRRGRIGYAIGRLALTLRLARALRAFRPHLLVISTGTPEIFIAFASRRAPVVLSVHNTFWPRGRRPAGAKRRARLVVTRLCMARISGAICTSEECRRQLAELRGSDAGLAVQTPQMEKSLLAAPPRVSEAASRLLFIGRITDSKGVFDLLEAFERLAPRFPAATLDFAGDGEAIAALAARVAASPASERVRLLGRLSGSEVHSVLNQADLLICPTRSCFSEGLAMVVLEAAAHGVPSVVSSVVPAADYFPNACLEFPADNVDALRVRIEEVLASPERFRELRRRAAADRAIFADRSRSWGSNLARILIG